VGEIATNTVTHGYAENALKGEVSITAGLEPERLIITLEAQATTFDPRGIITT